MVILMRHDDPFNLDIPIVSAIGADNRSAEAAIIFPKWYFA